MSLQWIEIIIDADVDAGELLGILDDPCVNGAWQENGTVRLYWPTDQWDPTIVPRLKQVLERLPGGRRPNDQEMAVTIRSIPAEDWNRRWTASVEPIRVGRRFVIRPSWATTMLRPGDIELVLDPKQAFGTGHHATTQLVLEWLEDGLRSGEQVLDVGTGSGILAMAALRLGARAAVGIDHDPTAIECAREYARLNGFGSELQLHIGTIPAADQHTAEPLDLILANLDRRTVLSIVPELVLWLRRGCRLVLSGFLKEDQEDIAMRFAKGGAAIRSSRERDGWIVLEIG